MSNPDTHKSLAFTIRPRDGVKSDGSLEQSVIKYITKHKGFVCSEKEEQARHLHGQIFYDTERGKSIAEFKKILMTYQEKDLNRPLTPAEKKHGFRIKIAYSDEYYSEYCAKEDGMLYEDMPDDTSSYYPTKEEQDKAQAKANAVDRKYFALEEKYNIYSNNVPPKGLKDIARFLYDAMFTSRTIHVIEDPKKRKQTINSLYEYILKDNSRAVEFMVPELSNKQWLGNLLAKNNMSHASLGLGP